jgi:putative chitinase
MGTIDRKRFFTEVRGSLFGGKLTTEQVDGMTRILDYRESKWSRMPNEELAYLLATVKHETANEMQPIRERGSERYLRSKPYWPWIGGGLIQLTWKRNYDRFGIPSVDAACSWDGALDVAFRGMIFGMFTGKKLSDYIVPGKTVDFKNARRIINGTDRAALVAGYAVKFLSALNASEVEG